MKCHILENAKISKKSLLDQADFNKVFSQSFEDCLTNFSFIFLFKICPFFFFIYCKGPRLFL